MHLIQVEEVKAQSQEIQCLSTLVEQQQKTIKQLTTSKSPVRETRTTLPQSGSQFDAMREEIFNLIMGW